MAPQDLSGSSDPKLADRLRLDVDSRWLFAIAGVIWTGVGILLLSYAVQWLAPEAVPVELELVVVGIAVAAVFVRFIFHGIVRKNIDRIEAGPARASAFAFQGWKSYLITVFMIGLGDPEDVARTGLPRDRYRAARDQPAVPPPPALAPVRFAQEIGPTVSRVRPFGGPPAAFAAQLRISARRLLSSVARESPRTHSGVR
jgi:hypothetical protein